MRGHASVGSNVTNIHDVDSSSVPPVGEGFTPCTPTGAPPASLMSAPPLSDPIGALLGSRGQSPRSPKAYSKGSSATGARLALLDGLRTLIVSGKPPTVYRALDFLLAQGLIHRVELLNAFVGCHDEAVNQHAAQFLIFRECGRVTELEDAGVQAAIGLVAKAHGFAPSLVTVGVDGACNACIGKQAVLF